MEIVSRYGGLKMKVLFATTNPSKIRYYADNLKKDGFDLITLQDINLDLKVEENGRNPVENAIIKAKIYYEATGLITIAVDDGLFIDNLPDNKQPGNEVRRVNGKRLNDQEMINYYISLVHELGGKAKVHWLKGIAIYNGKTIKTFEKYSHRLFIDKTSPIIHEGYPLDSITYWEQLNKYTSELTSDEWLILQENHIEDILDFIKGELKSLTKRRGKNNDNR
jgi:inosine/xanthosine triphosphate pyrophosphatase family protein